MHINTNKCDLHGIVGTFLKTENSWTSRRQAALSFINIHINPMHNGKSPSIKKFVISANKKSVQIFYTIGCMI